MRRSELPNMAAKAAAVCRTSANAIRCRVPVAPLTAESWDMLARVCEELGAAVCESPSPAGYVRIPTSADEAATMVLLGTEYLKQHAPERLRTGGTSDAG